MQLYYHVHTGNPLTTRLRVHREKILGGYRDQACYNRPPLQRYVRANFAHVLHHDTTLAHQKTGGDLFTDTAISG